MQRSTVPAADTLAMAKKSAEHELPLSAVPRVTSATALSPLPKPCVTIDALSHPSSMVIEAERDASGNGSVPCKSTAVKSSDVETNEVPVLRQGWRGCQHKCVDLCYRRMLVFMQCPVEGCTYWTSCETLKLGLYSYGKQTIESLAAKMKVHRDSKTVSCRCGEVVTDDVIAALPILGRLPSDQKYQNMFRLPALSELDGAGAMSKERIQQGFQRFRAELKQKGISSDWVSRTSAMRQGVNSSGGKSMHKPCVETRAMYTCN